MYFQAFPYFPTSVDPNAARGVAGIRPILPEVDAARQKSTAEGGHPTGFSILVNQSSPSDSTCSG
jgi:hypothetical protein